jgi:hypothetical protein
MADANPNFSTLVSTTLKNYRKQLADNVTGHQALFWMLKEKGFYEERDGGETLVEPLMTGLNSTVASYDGYDILDTTPQEGISSAEFAWKQIAGSVSLSGREEFQNSGSKTKIVSLLESKVRQLEISMQLEVNEQLFGDGTGNGSKDLTGINIAVEEGTAWSTYGGIDSNTYTFWRNTWTAAGSVLTLADMRSVFNSASRGNSRPKLILTTQEIYEQYEALLVANNDITRTDTKMGDAGFQNLLFKQVPLVFDEDVPTGVMLFLNPEFMKFVVGKGRNFVTTPFMKPENQDAKVSQVLLYANLLMNNRARQGRLDDIDALV